MNRRVPTIFDQGDLKGGLFHLLAEIGALATLLGVMALLAWLLLLI